MATDKRFVVKNGLQTENINFVFNDSVLGSSNITATMLSSNTLSFSGSTGQLFSITDSMTGVIFAVNDISGVPSIEVYDDGRVYFAETFGNVTIGNSTISSSRISTSTTTGILQVAGGAGITGNLNVGGTRNLFTGSVGIGTSTPLGTNANVFSVYGSAMVYGNIDLANPTGGTSGIYFNDGTYQTTAFTGAATPSFGTAGTIQYAGAGNTFAGNSDNFFWDTANNRLGIGTNTPTNVLTVRSTTTPAWFNTVNSAVSSNNFEIIVGNGASTGTTVGYVNNTAVPYGYISTGTNTRNITVAANGRVGVGGVTAPQVLLDVGGGAVIGASWAGNSNFINPPASGLAVQGSIGIGTYTPLSSLDVRGGVGVTAASNFNSGLSVASLTSNGAISGTTYTGTWSGNTIAIDNGGTGATDAATARTNLGLGTIATQNANSVNITGGAISVTTGNLTVASLTNTSVISINQFSNAFAQLPFSGIVWHDLLRFLRYYTTTAEVTNDNITWTSATVDKKLFSGIESQTIEVIADSGARQGIRWIFNNASISYSYGEWLVLGVTYSVNARTFQVLVESSLDGVTWTQRHLSTNTMTAMPIFCRVSDYDAASWLRVSIIRTAGTGSITLSSIRLITARWGDQGRGKEIEFPYNWDENANITTLGNLAVTRTLSVTGTTTVASLVSNSTITGTAATFTSSQNSGLERAANIVSNTWIHATQNLTVASSNASTTSATGALVVTGGVGIGGRLNVAGNSYYTGILNTGSNLIAQSINSNTNVVGINIQSTGQATLASAVINTNITTSSLNSTGAVIVSSLNSNTNVVATNIQSTGQATVASLVSNGAVSGTTGTFTGALYGANFNTAGTATVNALVSNTDVKTATVNASSTIVGQSINSNTTIQAAGTVEANAIDSNTTITAGTGLTVTSGGINVTGVSQFTGNVSISGNLNVVGTINTQNANVLIVNDPIIYIGEGNTGTNWDLGLVGNYNDGTYEHTGFVRNHVTGVWTLFDTLPTEPNVSTGNVDWSNSSLTYAAFLVGNVNVAGRTESVSTTTGAIRVIGTGGVGIGGRLNVGGSTWFAGTLNAGGALIANSINSNTNVVGANLQSTGQASVASLVSNGAVSGTTGTFTSALYGASFNSAGTATVNALVSNGAISGTTITGTAGTFTSIQNSGLERAANIVSNTWIHATQNLTVASSNASTTTATGAAVITGGVGVGGRLNVGGAAWFASTLNAGGAFIAQSINSNTNVVATNIQSTGQATVSTLVSNGAISGTTITGTVGTFTSIQNSGNERASNIVSNTWIHATQNLTVASSNASTTTSTGALVVTGGVGVGGNLNVNGTVNYFAGSVGVGVTNPTRKFQVLGTTGVIGGFSGTTHSIRLESDVTYGLTGAAVSAADTTLFATYQPLIINGSQLGFAIQGTERMRIDANGNLGLGVTPNAWFSSIKAVDINTAGAVAASTNAVEIYLNSYFDTGGTFRYRNTNPASKYEQSLGAHKWYIAPSGGAGNAVTFTQSMTLDANGNLGLGISPAVRLHSYQFFGGTTARLQTGTTANGNFLDFYNASSTRQGLVGFIDSTNLYVHNDAAASIIFDTSDTERMRIDQNGNVGIGTSTVQTGYKLQVQGGFAAITKSFVIDHPTKPGMKLQYASLEGPENGVYVRGRLRGESRIELPDYWLGLVDNSTITVNLTAIGRPQNLYVSDINQNSVWIGAESDADIHCFYTVYAERKDIEKLVVEYGDQ